MTDPLALLKDADPVEHLRDEVDLDAPPPAAVLARIVQRPARRRPRRALVALPLAACAVLAAAVAVLAPGGSVDPAARAYAQTAPGEHVLFTDVTTTMVMTGLNPQTETFHDRMWQHGDRSHRLTDVSEDDDDPGTPRQETYEYVKDGDVLRNRLPDGKIQTLRASEGAEARQILRTENNFVDAFRSRYAGHKLRDDGETTFAGRPARAYAVTDPDPGNTETYYLDPQTGDPLGSIRTYAIYETKIGPDHKPVQAPGPQVGEARYTEVVHRLEHLPLTPENLAKLTAPWATRSARR
jgi:hypothetical protein